VAAAPPAITRPADPFEPQATVVAGNMVIPSAARPPGKDG
jgi:hypothetical protein